MHHDLVYPVQYIKWGAEAGGRNENNTVYHHPSLPLPFAVWLPRQTRDRGSYTIDQSPGTNQKQFFKHVGLNNLKSISLNYPSPKYVAIVQMCIYPPLYDILINCMMAS